MSKLKVGDILVADGESGKVRIQGKDPHGFRVELIKGDRVVQLLAHYTELDLRGYGWRLEEKECIFDGQ